MNFRGNNKGHHYYDVNAFPKGVIHILFSFLLVDPVIIVLNKCVAVFKFIIDNIM